MLNFVFSSVFLFMWSKYGGNLPSVNVEHVKSFLAGILSKSCPIYYKCYTCTLKKKFDDTNIIMVP